MADFVVKKEYTDTMAELTAADKADATVFNKLVSLLINNDAFLKNQSTIAEGHIKNGELHVTDADKKAWNAKAGVNPATEVKDGLLTAQDKIKLNSVKQNAEENQTAFSSVKAGASTIEANSKTAGVHLVPGKNIGITGDNATKTITIGIQNDGMNRFVTDAEKETWNAKADTVPATESKDGLLTAQDKVKLNTVKQKAEENQNTFASVKVGGTTVSANGKSSQLQLTAGENIIISADNATRTINIRAEGGGNYIGVSPPAKTNLLWTDTSAGGVLKYYNGTSWVPIKSVWG